MANYLTVNTKFEPFSYERYLSPMKAIADRYDAAETAYSDLSAKADLWENIINENTDPDTYSQFKSYSEDLKNQADLLATEGLTSDVRRALLKMKKRYSSDIIPIENAYNRRNELIKKQEEVLAKDPSAMFNIDASKLSLDEVVKNPAISYTTVSGDALYTKGKEAGLSASSRHAIGTAAALGNQYFEIKRGYGDEAARKFLTDQTSIPELKEAINRIVSQSGVTDDNKQRAIDYTISGIMAGMSENIQYQQNRNFQSDADKTKLDLIIEEHDANIEATKTKENGILLPDGSRVKLLPHGRGYFTITPDGQISMTPLTRSGGSSDSDSQTFVAKDYKGKKKFETSESKSKVTFTDNQKVAVGSLSSQAINTLSEDLSGYGLSLNDVDVYKSGKKYRVVIKDEDPNLGYVMEKYDPEKALK